MPQAPEKLQIFYGISSPWAYFGAQRAYQIAAEAGAEVVLRPIRIIEANGGIPLRRRPDARQRYHAIELDRWRNYLGIPLNLAPKFYPCRTIEPAAQRLRGRIDRALADAGVTPPSLLVTNASTNALIAARAGLGIAIVEPATAYALQLAGLEIRPLDVVIPYFWGVFTLAGRAVSKPIGTLITILGEVSAEIMPNFRLRAPEEMDSLRDAIFGPAGERDR